MEEERSHLWRVQGVKMGCEHRRPVGWQCAPEFVGLEGEGGGRREEGGGEKRVK